MKNHAWTGFAILLLAAMPAQAAETPAPGRLDPRIRTIAYNPDQVIRVDGFPGYQITIQFESGERIENVALGDSMSWQVTPNKKANLLFVKPLAQSGHTNMSVVTDQRNYNFELIAKPNSLASQDGLIFNLRFEYAEGPRATTAAMPVPDPRLAPENWNFAYRFKGAKANRPARVYDDGKSTYFRWDKAVPIPAIFAVGADKRESLVNYRVKGRSVVVDQIGRQFVLRYGKHVTHVFNEGIRNAEPARPAEPQVVAHR